MGIRSVWRARQAYSSFIDGVVAEQQRILTFGNQVNLLEGRAQEFLRTQDPNVTRNAVSLHEQAVAILDRYEEATAAIAAENPGIYQDYGERIETIRGDLARFWETHEDIVSLWQEKGTGAGSGLRGEFQSAAADVEEAIQRNQSTALLVEYLSLRRHEKDYLLRQERRYRQRHEEALARLRGLLSESALSAPIVDAIGARLDDYAQAFAGVVDVDNRLLQARTSLARRGDQLAAAVAAELVVSSQELDRVREETEQEISLFIAITAGAAGAAAVFFLVMAVLIVRRVSRPVTMLLRAADRISAGDLSQSVVYGRSDEFGRIAEGLDHASGEIRRLIADARKAADASSTLGQSLAEAATESAASITEITANTRSMAEQNRSLAEKTTESAKASERMAEETVGMNSLVENQSSVVAETTSAVEEMIANIRNVTSIAEGKQKTSTELVEIAEKGGAEVQNTNTIATEIGELAGNIEEVINVINGISAQTNLLAMNAAIEAAHAGDAGRGFAVVAAEIRNLAESSSSNAKRIADMLKHVTDRIRAVTDSSSRSTALFAQIREGIASYSASLDEIAEAMREMSIGSNQVLQAAEEMSTNSGQLSERSGQIRDEVGLVRDGAKEVDDLAAQVAGGLEEIRNALGEIDASVNQLSALSNDNQETFRNLEAVLARFSVETTT